jgi:hypothetical protein
VTALLVKIPVAFMPFKRRLDISHSGLKFHIFLIREEPSTKITLRVLSATAAVGLVSEVVGPTATTVVRARFAGILRARGRIDGSGARTGRGLRGALTLTVVVLVLEATAAAARARWDGGLRSIVVHAFPTRGSSLTSIST